SLEAIQAGERSLTSKLLTCPTTPRRSGCAPRQWFLYSGLRAIVERSRDRLPGGLPMFPSLFHKNGKTNGKRGRHRSTKAARLCRPLLEPLESRTLLNAGDLDPAFGAGGLVRTVLPNAQSTSVIGSVVEPDQKIVVGAATFNGAKFVPTLVRYNPD